MNPAIGQPSNAARTDSAPLLSSGPRHPGPMRLAAFLFVALVALAGCADPAVPRAPVGSTTAPEAPVAPGDDAMGGHVHDYWQGALEKTLMDTAVTVTVSHNHLFDEPPRPQHLHNCDEQLVSTAQGGTVTFTLPTGEIVPPGTDRLVFTFTWSEATIGALRFQYRPPSHGHLGGAEGDGHDHSGLTDAGLITNGEPIELTLMEGMADLGHDARSHWAFYICADPASPGISQGAVNMQVEAFRVAELTPDPPHPDHWNGQASLHLASYLWSGQTWSAANQGDGNWHHLVFHDGATVPMGTNRIAVDAWLNQTGATADTLPVQLLLYYHDAAQVDWIYRTLQPLDAADGHWQFEVSLENEEGWDALDSPYASATMWDVWLRVISDTNQPTPLGAGRQGVPLIVEGTLEATVVALST